MSDMPRLYEVVSNVVRWDIRNNMIVPRPDGSFDALVRVGGRVLDVGGWLSREGVLHIGDFWWTGGK